VPANKVKNYTRDDKRSAIDRIKSEEFGNWRSHSANPFGFDAKSKVEKYQDAGKDCAEEQPPFICIPEIILEI